jgi:hypothetical protein
MICGRQPTFFGDGPGRRTRKKNKQWALREQGRQSQHPKLRKLVPIRLDVETASILLRNGAKATMDQAWGLRAITTLGPSSMDTGPADDGTSA